jgi:abequosyltransferase
VKLAICIPTHHGRVDQLRTLLESVVQQVRAPEDVCDLQICISDNASADGTERLVRGYCERYGSLFKYRRNATDTGIRNFFGAVELADADYCWLVGSDDALVPTALSTVCRHLAASNRPTALTVNKLNFDLNLASLRGPDNQAVLPVQPGVTRTLRGRREILTNLFLAFSFISTHVFKKVAWNRVVEEFGVEYILRFRHFPHVFVYSQMAAAAHEWLWVADYCVIQRLDSFSLAPAGSDKPIAYVDDLSTDLERLARELLPDPTDYRSIVRRVFFVYWNPLYVLKYRAVSSDREWSSGRVVTNCKDRFRSIWVFWLLTYPVLVMPQAAARLTSRLLGAVLSGLASRPLARAYGLVQACFQALLRAMGAETDWNSAPARAAARAYLAGVGRREMQPIDSTASAKAGNGP